MMKMNKLFLVGCGLAMMGLLAAGALYPFSQEQKWAFPEMVPPDAKGDKQLVVVGNSITVHSPNAEIGWNNNNGMAAPSLEADYAHRLATLMNVTTDKLFVANLYPVETDKAGLERAVGIVEGAVGAGTKTVVIQLGDNVPNTPEKMVDFSTSIMRLVDVSKSFGAHVLCTSTYWTREQVDAVIKSSCEGAGGTFVSIAGLYGNAPQGEMVYTHKGVNKHPKIFDMNEIAKRLHQAVKEPKS